MCFSNDSDKYRKAKEWQVPVVNVQWLSDLIVGYTDALRMPIAAHYLQISKGDQFQMDWGKVQLMMGKSGRGRFYKQIMTCFAQRCWKKRLN